MDFKDFLVNGVLATKHGLLIRELKDDLVGNKDRVQEHGRLYMYNGQLIFLDDHGVKHDVLSTEQTVTITGGSGATGYTMADNMDLGLITTAAGGALTIALPDATLCSGRAYTFVVTAYSGSITLDPYSTQTINGSTTDTSLVAQYQYVTLVSNGANWLKTTATSIAYDAELNAIAGLTSAANKVPMFSGTGTATLLDFKDEDNMASDSATAVPSQQSVKAYAQPLDAELTAIAGLTSAADKGIQFTGSGTAAVYDLTAAAKTVLDDASVAAMRTTLEVNAGFVNATVKQQVKTTSTLAEGDVGQANFVATDGQVLTLPATVAGMTFTIVNGGADGAVGITIAPNAIDKIMGAGLTSEDDKDLVNTKATAITGDFVTLVGDGVDGWYVQAMKGIWAREA